jgi:hypothetical protein
MGFHFQRRHSYDVLILRFSFLILRGKKVVEENNFIRWVRKF